MKNARNNNKNPDSLLDSESETSEEEEILDSDD